MSNKLLIFKMILLKISRKDPVYELFIKNKKTLDVACGEGNLLKNDKENIYGIDINKTLLEQLKNEGLKVKYSDVTKIDFEDSVFDVVHCSNIIEHLDPESAHKMFQEMNRVLKPEGVIILITPTEKTIWNTFGHIKPYTPQSIKKLLRKVSLESFDSIQGLRIENVVYYGSWGWNKFTFLYSSLMANLTPFMRGLYIMTIKKY